MVNDGPEKEARLDAAVLRWMQDLAAQGTLLTDEELRVLGWNHWLEAHTGRRASEVVGRNLLELFPELAERRLDRYYLSALQGQVSVLSQRLHGHLLSMPAAAGQKGFERMQQSARISPLTREGRVIGTLTVIDDVTERVAREAELQSQLEARSRLLASEKAAREEAELANRLKDDFLATISHELRTPLTAIIGWSNMLRSGKLDDKMRARAVETIHRNAYAQNQLISDLLDVSRIISGKLRLDVRAVELPPILEAALDSVRPAAEAKEIRLHALIDPLAGPISGDADRLQQIIWNLLTNAVKFTPKHGKVQLKLERVESHVEITVSDSGIGIAPDFLPYVFDRFRQADAAATRHHGGLGLGLSIVRQLTELHGGTARVESEGEGRGASFCISLPFIAVKGDPEGPGPAHPTAGGGGVEFDCPPSLEGLRVLVVDDEQDTRDLLRAVLERCGSEVTGASSAAEALAAVEALRPDVIVSDLGMPGEDGYALIAKVRALPAERGGRTPAAALTAYARTEDRLRVLRSGFQIHLPKPVEPAELVTVVANLSGRVDSEAGKK
ncbi:MAG: response regulator [Acidobacteria bacterium]|nr:response regulator [Acidobacteriota bacterium]